MLGSVPLAFPGFSAGAPRRLRLALNPRRLAAVGVTTLLLSLGALVDPGMLDFFSPAEIAVAWFEHFAELAVIAAGLMLAYALLDETLPRTLPLRLAVLGALVFACASGSSLLLHAYYGHGFSHLPPPLRLLADSLHWGLPAVFLVLIGDVHQRALAADSAAHAAELARAQQGQGESEQQLALLQAQIEPHFLFNVLGNVRRLYRTEPQAGADAIGSLMRYLRSALPQVRNASGTLGDEIELVRAYLQLQRMRMGPRLGFSIECEPKLQAAEFPPMLAMTLVENAIRHGVEPAGGGRVGVRALRDGDRLVLEVVDDGLGFGGAPSSGTGVGLANVRRQLAARHGEAGRLRLEAAAPRGARATLSLPLRAADTASPA